MTRLIAEDPPKAIAFVWSEFVLVLIIFGLLFFLVRKYVVPAFESGFAKRRDAIEGGIERAEKAQAEAAELLRAYQLQLAAARTEAAQIRDGARAEGQRIVEDMRTTAQAESARIVARGEELLATQRATIVRELRGELGTLAVQLSERIVGQQLSNDAQVSATVDQFLASLESAPPARPSESAGASA
jgi:F-type H+-transporting ATPase subunit b